MPVPEDVTGRELFVSLLGFPSGLWCAAGVYVLETHSVALKPQQKLRQLWPLIKG